MNPFELDDDEMKVTQPPPRPQPLQPQQVTRDTQEHPALPGERRTPPKPNAVYRLSSSDAGGNDRDNYLNATAPPVQIPQGYPPSHYPPTSLSGSHGKVPPHGYPPHSQHPPPSNYPNPPPLHNPGVRAPSQPNANPPAPHKGYPPSHHHGQDRPISMVQIPSQPQQYQQQQPHYNPQPQPQPQQQQPAQPLQPAKKLTKYDFNALQRDQPPLAKGSYGVVYTGKAPGLEQKIVIKDMQILNQKTVEDWRRETLLMGENKSPFIADVYGYSSLGPTLTIVMEFFPFGDLYTVLHKKPEKHPLSTLQRCRMARHCLHGVLFLHSKSIIHRDIKSMNILVTEDYTCKLTDFGNAKMLMQSNANNFLNTQNSGTPLWMAPEVKTGVYSFPADIFSLGLVFYEFFEKKLPDYNQQLGRVVLPPQFKSASLVIPMVHTDPNRRQPLNKVLESLDQKVNDLCVAVLDGMPEKGLEKLRVDAGLKPEDDLKAEEIKGKVLHTLYKQLLTRPPTEIDPLCSKMFPVYQGSQAQLHVPNQQPQYGQPQLQPQPQPFPMQGQPFPVYQHQQSPQPGYGQQPAPQFAPQPYQMQQPGFQQQGWPPNYQPGAM